MSESINLSIGRQEVKTEIKKYVWFALIFLIAVFLFTGIAMGINYIYATRFEKLVAQEADIQARIQAQSAKKAKLLLLHERLATASKIVTQRKDLNTRFAEIIAMSPNDVTIASTDISSQLISVGYKSKNLATLNDMLNTFYNLDARDSKIKTVKVNTFKFTKQVDTYMLDLDFLF